MPLFSFEGVSPTVHPDAWIAPTATLIGDVTVEANASVWYGAVLRADFGPIVIREGANVPDNSVIHAGEDGCEIGRDATIGHSCVVHDCTIGEQALIGNSATIQDRAEVGARTLVAAGALVAPKTAVPAEVLAIGTPAKKFVPLTDSARGWVEHNPSIYAELARRHRASVTPVNE
ncbi:MAG: gamma carbonic anhydrase family protein [Pseudonocardiaceae bacterium]|nr:gamma carbonic anhydrase family protein [Pseudonocardiaceae bacterium]